MQILGQTDDDLDLRMSRIEARALYNLLVESESWPFEAVGPRPFIRQLRETLGGAIQATADDETPPS